MKGMRTVALVVTLLVAGSRLAGAAETEERKKEATTYESPVLSLLFLPANILIKMASLLAPDDSSKTSRETARSADSGK
jgi:hypothetical protein